MPGQRSPARLMKHLLLCAVFQPSLLLLSRIGSPGLIDKDAVREQDERARLGVAGIQTRGLNQRVCARLIAPWSQCTDELYCSLLFSPIFYPLSILPLPSHPLPDCQRLPRIPMMQSADR